MTTARLLARARDLELQADLLVAMYADLEEPRPREVGSLRRRARELRAKAAKLKDRMSFLTRYMRLRAIARAALLRMGAPNDYPSPYPGDERAWRWREDQVARAHRTFVRAERACRRAWALGGAGSEPEAWYQAGEQLDRLARAAKVATC
jgi:hypothetical protein